MKQNVISIVIFFYVILLASINNNVYALSTDEAADTLNLSNYANSLEKYISKGGIVNESDITSNLISGKGINISKVITNILKKIFIEIVDTVKSMVSVLVIIILISVVQSMDMDKAGITEVANYVLYISITSILIKNFLEIITLFKGTCTEVTVIMQIVSPFLMLVMLAKGGTTTVSFTEPMLLFASSLIGFVITNIIVPFITIAVAFNVVNSLNEKIGLSKFSKMFLNVSVSIVGLILTVFLGVLSMETGITSSVDELALKTISSAVSNFVPVVGKFFSDSFASVMGAAEIVGKVGGFLGIIATISVIIMPVIKIISVSIMYNVLSLVAQPICDNKSILNMLDGFGSIYKTLSGIIIAVGVLFIISIAIMINVYTAIK